MKLRLSVALFTIFLVFGVLFPLKESSFSKRSPAAVEENTCFSLMKSFFGPPQSRVSKIFSAVTGIGRESKFDYGKFVSYKRKYELQITSGSVENLDFERTPESLLALAEVMNRKNHLELGPSLQHLSYRKSRAVEKATKKLLGDRPLRVEDLENSISEIYSIILGPTFKLRDSIGEAGKRRMMFRVFAEDAAINGLLPVLKKYKIFKDASKYQKLINFLDTKKGKTLLTGLLNLPVIWGIPPFYLPGMKRIRIPHEMVKEAMEKGMSDEMANRMIKAVNDQLVASGSLKMETQAKYRVFRRHYMYGIAAFTFYIMYSDFRLAEQYREENRVYEEALEEVSETVSDLELLEERGFDLFERAEEASTESSLSTSFCRAIEDCLNSEKEDTGVRPIEGSDSYKACKEFMDPDNQCDRY